MNLTISPVKLNHCNRPQFKGYTILGSDDEYNRGRNEDYKIDYDIYSKDLSKAKSEGTNQGCALGVIGAALLGFMLIGAEDKNDKKQTEKFINKIDSVYKSKDIRTDEFMVKDVNDDKCADFILFKKDGSKVVIDINNRRVIDENNK